MPVLYTVWHSLWRLPLTQRIRPILAISSLAFIVWASFAAGQHLRRVAAGPIERQSNRVASLPENGIGGTSENATPAAQDNGVDPAETFQTVLNYVKSDYVDKIADDKKLGFGAIKTMLVSLDDPKSRFLEPEQRKQMEEQINGQFAGIGAVLSIVKQKKNSIDQRLLTITAPAPGSPADKAGLRAGDVITEVNGRWVIAYDPRLDLNQLPKETEQKELRARFKELTQRLEDGMSLPKALDVVTANDGKKVELTIERAGSPTPIKVSVTNALTTVEPVEFRTLSGDVGYLRVTQFNEKATKAFSDALAGAKQKSLILDLRDNAGAPVVNQQTGALNSALSLLARLTKGGKIGAIVNKANKTDALTVTAVNGTSHKIVVLTNGGTANLSELVASALKEKAGATLIGDKTAGDAVFQKLIPLRDNAAMTLATGKMLTANGADFSGKGLTPDVAVPTGAPRTDNDPAVQRAISALTGA